MVLNNGPIAGLFAIREAPHGTQLAALASQFDAVTERALQLFDRYPSDALARRPAAARWSAAECLLHLTRTADIYGPLLDSTIEAARSRGLCASGPYPMDLPGRFLRWLLEPPVRFRTRTFASAEPLDVGPPEEVLAAFVSAQDSLLARMRSADGVALDRVSMVSPFDQRVRYNLLSCFAILAAHERRHLWQAARAVRTASASLSRTRSAVKRRSGVAV